VNVMVNNTIRPSQAHKKVIVWGSLQQITINAIHQVTAPNSNEEALIQDYRIALTLEHVVLETMLGQLLCDILQASISVLQIHSAKLKEKLQDWEN